MLANARRFLCVAKHPLYFSAEAKGKISNPINSLREEYLLKILIVYPYDFPSVNIFPSFRDNKVLDALIGSFDAILEGIIVVMFLPICSILGVDFSFKLKNLLVYIFAIFRDIIEKGKNILVLRTETPLCLDPGVPFTRMVV